MSRNVRGMENVEIGLQRATMAGLGFKDGPIVESLSSFYRATTGMARTYAIIDMQAALQGAQQEVAASRTKPEKRQKVLDWLADVEIWLDHLKEPLLFSENE